MTYLYRQEHTFEGGRVEKTLLKWSIEGEYFGVGLFGTMIEMYPQHVEPLRACLAMERFNLGYCESFTADAGIHISEKRADTLRGIGEKYARKHDFDKVAKAALSETPEADALYSHLAKGAGTPELKTLGDDLVEHENALRDWLRSERDGRSDGGEKVFAYLERHGITRDQVLEGPLAPG